nr:uroporphyrinogen-III C-methyltransferase [uncultured Sellimonas sp.]
MEKEQTGKVWIAGAGPGDAGLLTIKTAQLLKEADVVVYDALISTEILSMIPEQTEKINVGKRADHHLVPQEEINRILCREAKKGKKVLRLKGGDPFVFGRGGEEIELLQKENIPFEIVPGITSGAAVPAYAGIPVTHRDYTSSFHVVTGHARKGGTSRIHYKALVELDATLVFLMGVTASEEICKNLMEAGMDPEMPAAVIQDGTLKSQRKVISTVQHLPEEIKKEKIEAPAVIVIGRVCELAGRFSWWENRILAGKQILVTRPQKQCSVLAEQLRKLGAQVIELPCIRTHSIEEKEGREQIDKAVTAAGQRLEEGKEEWLVFTSAAGVQAFFEFLDEEELDIRRFYRASFGVIGKGTAMELKKHGIRADVMPEVYEAGKLGKVLAEQVSRDAHVTILRAKCASRELLPPLQKKGISYTDVPVYETVIRTDCVLKEKIGKLFEKNQIDYVTFTSASTVKGFVQAMEGEVCFSDIHALCIGRKTEEEALKYGMKTEVSNQATIESMVEWIKENR